MQVVYPLADDALVVSDSIPQVTTLSLRPRSGILLPRSSIELCGYFMLRGLTLALHGQGCLTNFLLSIEINNATQITGKKAQPDTFRYHLPRACFYPMF